MTKTIAKAAQKFPQSGVLVRVSQRGVLALMLGTVALPVSGVWAQTVLWGTRNTTQGAAVSPGLPLVVTTAPGFSVDTTGLSGRGGKGINLFSTGGISFTDDNQAAITGYTKGINAVNSASLVNGVHQGTSLTITTTGVVTGKSDGGYSADGILATNEYGGDLTISVASVISAGNGIHASGVQNTGALSITATGAVSGGSFNANSLGIDASNEGTDLTISATTVTDGIRALNKGSGLLSITTTGEVTNRINAYNKYGTDLTIDVANVSGNILAKNYGTGALAITASGDVSAQYGYAIIAYNYNKGTDLAISVASVSGSAKGIYAKNYGSGALAITATDTVTGTSGRGIDANANYGTDLTISAASVSGGTTGIFALNYYGSGALEITATGAVTGTSGDGIYALGNYGTDLTISAASVTGGTTGIYAKNYGTGALAITATGAVTGTLASGIFAYGYGTDLTISAASVFGGTRGILVTNYGTGALDITATGAVTGAASSGISATGYEDGTDLTISATSVSGYGKGIFAKNKGKGELAITTTGAVTSTNDDGIYAYGKGTDLTIAATSVSGSGKGIYAKNKGTGALEITTTGSVSAAGEYSDGISAINYGTDLTISVNSVSGGKEEAAISADNKGSGKLSITVSGAVVAGASSWAYGIQTRSAAGGEVEIHLLSTSSVSGVAAIKDINGDAVVTIDAGALVTGSIGLEYGNDTLTIASGVNLSGVTFMSGGDDDYFNAKDYTDTLNISSGWLVGNLDDWEVINADTSGGDFALNGFTLGNRSFSKLGAGTLTLNGALTLASGSTLSMEVGQSSSDLIHAKGNAVIAGDLVVTPGLGLTFGHTYTLVSVSANSPTPNSVTGTFSDISIAGAFDYVATYNPTSVQLTLNAGSLVDFGGSALSPNARAVAGAFDAAVDGGYLPDGFVSLYLSADTLNAKLGELSGELHSAERRVALEDTSVVREAALDRLGYGLTGGADATAATGGGGAFWMRDFASWGTADADGTGSRATTDQAGFLMGADFVQGNVKYGGMFSYTNTNVDLGSLGYSKTNSTGAALYAGYRQDGAGLAFAAGGAFASTSATGERSISITGLEQTLTSTVQGTSYQIFGEVSNDLAKAGNVQIEPFARLAYAWAHSDAFAETGGIAALSGAAQTNDLRMATLGLRGAYVAGDTTLSGSAAWLRSAGDLSAPTTLSMAGVDIPYEVNSAALDEDAVELSAQASVDLAPDMKLAGGYSGTIGKNNATHGVRVTLSVAW